MTKYYRITENELHRLKSVTDTLHGMGGVDDDDFNAECAMAKKTMDSILKRAGLQRKKNEFTRPSHIEDAYDYE